MLNAERQARVDQACSLLNAMLQALADERSAVAKIDGAAIGEARQQKEQLAAQLAQLTAADRDQDFARSPVLKPLATQVMYQARANAALLADATNALASKLGIVRETSATYDRRARFRVSATNLVGRVF